MRNVEVLDSSNILIMSSKICKAINFYISRYVFFCWFHCSVQDPTELWPSSLWLKWPHLSSTAQLIRLGLNWPHHASCLNAVCLMPHASCCLPPASCSLPPVPAGYPAWRPLSYCWGNNLSNTWGNNKWIIRKERIIISNKE